jgi:hypothetical protein
MQNSWSGMLADIVDLVAERIKSGSTSPAGDEVGPTIPVATIASLAADERTLGFALPPLLKRLYLEVGNGGWGPGYGLLGLMDGAKDDLGSTAIEDYFIRLGDDPDDPAWRWPRGLLPICHWGCAIYSCVDCSRPNFPVIVFDPNVRESKSDGTETFFLECDGFEQWIQLWVDGHDLWERLYADDGVIAKIMQARASASG